MTRQLPFPPRSRGRMRLIGLQMLALALAAVLGAGAVQAQSSGEIDALDPPGRVGSISLLAGPVTLTDLQTGSREEAALNWPITAGWRVETGRTGRAEVRIGSTTLRLDDDTTVDFARLDDSYIQIAVLRGSASLTLRNRAVLDEVEVLTQRERIVFDDIGRYRFDVDRAPGQTAVTVFSGRARIGADGNSFIVAGGQRGEVSAPPMVRFQISGAVADRFDNWVAARDARDDEIRSAAYVSRETTGVELLDDYGDWRTVEEHGPIWFPRAVSPGWAPYRYGRWAWVDPWGWTWVDQAPWGFAPFHYGRWVVVGGVWGWVPGVIVPRPVYAPALVAWFSSPGISVSIGAPIGWFPLAPREVYVPAFRHTPRYLRVINVQHVPNVERVTIVQTPRYVHRHPDRSTWLPGDRFGRPDPVHRDVRPPPSEWRHYIARPQPPANVPNTKRRQHVDVAPQIARPPVRSAEPGPIVRPPAVVPRAVEAPRALPAPSQAVPSAPQPREFRGRGELPAVIDDGRRAAPRAVPAPSQSPPARELRGRGGHAAPDEARPVVPSAAPVPPPAPQPRDFRGRGELPAADDARRFAPRAVPAPTPAPQSRDWRGRGELPASAGDARRHVPRATDAPVRVVPALQAPTPEPARVDSDSGRADRGIRRAAPIARPDQGADRFERRTSRAPREAVR